MFLQQQDVGSNLVAMATTTDDKVRESAEADDDEPRDENQNRSGRSKLRSVGDVEPDVVSCNLLLEEDEDVDSDASTGRFSMFGQISHVLTFNVIFHLI